MGNVLTDPHTANLELQSWPETELEAFQAVESYPETVPRAGP